MRHTEVLNMGFNCVRQKYLSSPSEISRTVNLISSTTKFSGYKKQSFWIAPQDVLKAIDILQQIVTGVAHLFGMEPEAFPLFQSPVKITHKNAPPNQVNSSGAKVRCIENLQITQESRELLLASDESRAFHEMEFQIGERWLFSCHQYRRALAYYGGHTGIISESTGAALFKHVTLEMQRYYRNGFSQIKSIFGFYNIKNNQFEIPQDHFLFEFQTGVTNAMSRQIIATLFDTNTNYYGKRGGYLTRIRDNLKSDEAIILSGVKEIEKQVKEGEIAYKNTLLGGCMKASRCDDFLLGNFTACIECKSAIIGLDKLDGAIELCKKSLLKYQTDSAEYQLSSRELRDLIQLKNRICQRGEI